MSEIKLINKSSIQETYEKRMKEGAIITGAEMCDVVSPILRGKGGRLSDESLFSATMAAQSVGRREVYAGKKVKEYGSAFDVPRFCESLGKEMSVREMIKAGVFKSASMSSNTLIPDWQTLWDAMRIDISIKKAARETVRQNFYNVIEMPESSKLFSAVEFYPYGVVFEENNGEGQAVTQGETRAGGYESIEHFIYAAGFTWTLLAELFDKSFDPGKVTDAVMLAYAAKRDDLSIDPILDYSYSGTQQTAAATLSGANRQELLYLTLENAIDDLGKRTDPITGRTIGASDCRILANSLDARHIARVAGGLPSVNERSYPSLSEISRVVEYDGEVITLRASTVTYTGVTAGKCYLVKPNRYMNIGIKRNLQMEADMTPNVNTLASEQRSWYFVEGQQTSGLPYFIQEVTLPSW
jgi:hypothetical protein